MKKILIVEDDTSIQKIYSEKLKLGGFEVEVVSTGEGGVTSTINNPPDLILLDVMLQGKINGFDVLERLKKDPKTQEIPVIILTNLDSEEKVAKSIGALDYLIKANTSLEDIVGKVRQILKNA